MHYLLFYEVGEDYAARRAAFPDEHLKKAWAASEKGELVLGGALANPMDGAVLLFRGETPEVAERFAKSDPYVTSGTVKRWYIREWTTVAGEQAAMPLGRRPGACKKEQRARDLFNAGLILRMWRARSTAERVSLYVEHATRKVFPALRQIDGHRGAILLKRAIGESFDILVVTFWESMAAVRKFTGPDPNMAMVEPDALPGLTTFDDFVTHFEVVHSTFEEAP